MAIENTKQIDMYRVMLRIRAFEERLFKEFQTGKIGGALHLYTGEEAIATGACANLKPDDYITSTHRGHGHVIAKGGKTNYMMAELFGKKTGYNKGKGGSMHLADTDIGILGANGIVGGGIPIAGGAALSAQYRGTDQVTICFFGDGTVNSTRFHEGVNLASIWKLPIVYVVENNYYAESTSVSYSINIPEIADRAAAYGIPGITVDGNDVLAVYEAVGEAVARARRGEGPSLVVCNACRWGGHYTGDPQTYRTKEEISECMKKDPVARFKKHLIETGILTEAQTDKLQQEIAEEIDQAVKFAEESPFPEPEDALTDVYA
ncbi:thiamine pyrophosphate-dependent dehydrogenase E1 component subunit alpha [Chloroflexota bacterium]